MNPLARSRLEAALDWIGNSAESVFKPGVVEVDSLTVADAETIQAALKFLLEPEFDVQMLAAVGKGKCQDGMPIWVHLADAGLTVVDLIEPYKETFKSLTREE